MLRKSLSHSRHPAYYWASEGKAELDFIIEQDDFIYPLEVKSGNSSKKQSLSSLRRNLPSENTDPGLTNEPEKKWRHPQLSALSH